MKIKRIVLFCLVLCLMLYGCKGPAKTEEMNVYYLNADGNALLQEVYPKMGVEKALGKVKELSVITQGVKLEKYELVAGQLELYFGKEYAQLSRTTEVLYRAAIVQTLTQVDDVTFVSIYVEGEALRDGDGNAIGLMRAEDFVQNTGSSIDSYQTTDLTLYFANKDGKRLKESKKNNVRYHANTSIEKLVVEKLMNGTSASGSQSTIPKTAKLLGVSVKDGICYVNFDSKFSLDSYDLNPEVAIYSIVNSVIANGNVTKVQILIDGASDVVYKSSVDLSRPLEWKEDLIGE